MPASPRLGDVDTADEVREALGDGGQFGGVTFIRRMRRSGLRGAHGEGLSGGLTLPDVPVGQLIANGVTHLVDEFREGQPDAMWSEPCPPALRAWN